MSVDIDHFRNVWNNHSNICEILKEDVNFFLDFPWMIIIFQLLLDIIFFLECGNEAEINSIFLASKLKDVVMEPFWNCRKVRFRLLSTLLYPPLPFSEGRSLTFWRFLPSRYSLLPLDHRFILPLFCSYMSGYFPAFSSIVFTLSILLHGHHFFLTLSSLPPPPLIISSHQVDASIVFLPFVFLFRRFGQWQRISGSSMYVQKGTYLYRLLYFILMCELKLVLC